MVKEKIRCSGCGVAVRRDTKSGYCAKCFHANTNGVKTAYNAKRWSDGIAKISHWESRGAVLADADIESFRLAPSCGVCGKDFLGSDKCLDHCHDTGAYRGALCRQCNAAIGKLGDDLDLVISRLIRYRQERGTK
jgi:hypothetical protein